MNFKEQNAKERLLFVERWANYVKTHPDKDWSKQQNIIINSSLQSANMTREQYLEMKGEKYD
ncbi:MAG: hypothetical protein ACMXYE_05350 [Candidatus Woesearchaeota archaeon]